MNAPRIIAGAFKGRKLVVPAGVVTRPTAARTRQAAFDILLHAPWGGRELIHTAHVLDVFAGTGAFGLEALSRGAAQASFIEKASPALNSIKVNIDACQAASRSIVLGADALHPPAGTPHHLVFLDPPYAEAVVPDAIAALQRAGWISQDTIILAELGPEQSFMPSKILAERRHGKARLVFWRSQFS